MSTFAIVGDTHGAIRGMYKYLQEYEQRTDIKIDAVLQVGDFGILTHTAKGYPTDWQRLKSGDYNAPYPTWIVPGNHESWPELENYIHSSRSIHNIHILPDGGITNINGLRVGAIWGNFSPNSWNNPAIIDQVRHHDKNSVKAMHIYKPAVERLKLAGEFDMLLTHDASFGMMINPRQPSLNIKRELGLAPDEKATGCLGFNELYVTGRPKSHFFGHFHDYRVCDEGDWSKHHPVVICLHCFQYCKEQSVWIYQV